MATNIFEAAVKSTVKDLGSKVSEIRTNLANSKTKGVCGEATKCVVAQYIADRLPPSLLASVDGDAIEVGVAAPGYDEYIDITLFSIPTPAPIRRFISNFDNGKYPELVRE